MRMIIMLSRIHESRMYEIIKRKSSFFALHLSSLFWVPQMIVPEEEPKIQSRIFSAGLSSLSTRSASKYIRIIRRSRWLGSIICSLMYWWLLLFTGGLQRNWSCRDNKAEWDEMGVPYNMMMSLYVVRSVWGYMRPPPVTGRKKAGIRGSGWDDMGEVSQPASFE